MAWPGPEQREQILPTHSEINYVGDDSAVSTVQCAQNGVLDLKLIPDQIYIYTIRSSHMDQGMPHEQSLPLI